MFKTYMAMCFTIEIISKLMNNEIYLYYINNQLLIKGCIQYYQKTNLICTKFEKIKTHVIRY